MEGNERKGTKENLKDDIYKQRNERRNERYVQRNEGYVQRISNSVHDMTDMMTDSHLGFIVRAPAVIAKKLYWDLQQ